MDAVFFVALLLIPLTLLAILVLAVLKRGRPLVRPAAHVLAVLFLVAGVSLRLAGGPAKSGLQLTALAAVVESLIGLLSSRAEKPDRLKYWAAAFIAAAVYLLWTIFA